MISTIRAVSRLIVGASTERSRSGNSPMYVAPSLHAKIKADYIQIGRS